MNADKVQGHRHKLLCTALLKETILESAHFRQVPQPFLSSILMRENKWDRVWPEHQGVPGAQMLPLWL